MRKYYPIIMFSLLALCFGSCAHYPYESERMAKAFEQAQLVYGKGENDTVLFIPELDKVSAYYAHKKDYGKAALAALYYGYAEKEYDRTTAMESFKEAEQYGKSIHDSLTVARAQYQMGHMFYDNYMHESALNYLRSAAEGFGKQYGEKALTLNLTACCYMILAELDSAAFYFEKSLKYADLEPSNKVKRKILNNYAVLFRLKGENEKSIAYLKKVEPENDEQRLLNYLNLGDAFMAMDESDSAQCYYSRVEELLSTVNAKESTKVTIYNSLSSFEEKNGNYPSALNYLKLHDASQFEVMKNVGVKNELRIQQQFDYESAMNNANQNLLQRQRIITWLSLALSLIFIVLGIVLLRLLRIRKSELDLKASLIHYTAKNQELTGQIDSYKATIEDNEKNLSKALATEQRIMQKLAVYLDNPGDTSLLHTLKHTVWGSEGFWHEAFNMFDRQHPGLRGKLMLQYPNLSDQELKALVLSSMNASREDSALLLHISVHMVDKLRNNVKKKVSSLTV